jgi:dephospho-CoA kinase
MPTYRYQKPLIGLAGGIGSGKSFVAQALASEGCGVINSDQLGHDVLKEPPIIQQITQWWGPDVLDATGALDRKKIAQLVFHDSTKSQQLNSLIHPRVAALRLQRTAQFAANPAIPAIVWDTPLLFETQLNRDCDVVIFVKSPLDQRLARVAQRRGWTEAELINRENFQISLDNKEKLADYVLDNSGEASETLRQVQQVLSQILAKAPRITN